MAADEGPESRTAQVAQPSRDDPTLQVLVQALEHSPSAVVITDRRGSVLFANPRYCQIKGYDRDDLKGTKLMALSESSPLESHLCATVAAGQAWQGELASKRNNGETYWASAYIAPICSPNGQTLYFLAIIEEVNRAGDARPGTSTSVEFPARRAPDMQLVVDLSGTIFFINRTVSGIERDQTIGTTVFEYVPAEHHARLRRYLDEVARTRRSVTFEIPGVGPHGTMSHYVTRIGPIESEGRVVAISFITADITEEVAARGHAIDLRDESSERLRRLAEASIEGLAIHDNSRILDANEALARMFGYELSELTGRRPYDLVAPESHALLTAIAISGDEGVYEAVGLRKDGAKFPLDVCSRSLPLDCGFVRVTAFREAGGRGRRRAPWRPAARVKPSRWDAFPARPRARIGAARSVELSRRELEVLELLAQGLTNRKVAERLDVSSRTIDHHVSHILRKLEVPNRTAAAVVARQSGLLPQKPPR